MKRLLCRRVILAALLLSCVAPLLRGAPAKSEEEAIKTRYRALLIACDEFVTETEMTPIGANNLDLMEKVLARDTRGYAVSRQYGITATKEMLAQAIAWTFRDATEDDVSVLYISTHGAFDTGHNNPVGELIFSDGSMEERVNAQALHEMLDKVPGTKVLLVDACNSGALIGKGVSPDVGSVRVPQTFRSSDYKVLTSSGASEPSWYLQPTLEHAPPGSSYFTTALAVGAGLIGAYAADANQDGTITLQEMYEYLWVNQASSAVQMYPQDDDFPLLVYDAGQADTQDMRGELGGFVFASGALNAENPVLEFAYTAIVSTRVAYRITFLRDGNWDWVHGVTLLDDAAEDGEVLPGRKQVSLSLRDVLPDGWTYGMVHVMTLGDSEAGRQPFVYAGRVFSAETENADPDLAVIAAPKWRLRQSRELEIFVRHSIPGMLTVTIHDENGAIVRRLATSRSTRPQSLAPDGSLLYWNGLNNKGERVLPGTYQIRASIQVGQAEHQSEYKVVIE